MSLDIADLLMMIADHMQAKLRGDLQWIDEDNLVVGKTGRNIAQLWTYWL